MVLEVSIQERAVQHFGRVADIAEVDVYEAVGHQRQEIEEREIGAARVGGVQRHGEVVAVHEGSQGRRGVEREAQVSLVEDARVLDGDAGGCASQGLAALQHGSHVALAANGVKALRLGGMHHQHRAADLQGQLRGLGYERGQVVPARVGEEGRVHAEDRQVVSLYKALDVGAAS